MEVVNPAAPPPIIIVSKILCSFSTFIESNSVNFTLSGFVYGTSSINIVGIIRFPLLISSTLAVAQSYVS